MCVHERERKQEIGCCHRLAGGDIRGRGLSRDLGYTSALGVFKVNPSLRPPVCSEEDRRRLITAGIATATVTAAAFEHLHKLEHQRLLIPVQ